MADKAVNQNSIEMALKLTKEYVEHLKRWITHRRTTAVNIEHIASELEELKRDVGITKVVGSSMGVLGGIAAVAGTVMTGGLALPFYVGGLTANAISTPAPKMAEILDTLFSKDKCKSANEAFQAEENVTKIVQDKRASVDNSVNVLSKLLGLREGEILCALVMTTMRGKGFCHLDDFKVFQMLVRERLTDMMPKLMNLSLIKEKFYFLDNVAEAKLGSEEEVFEAAVSLITPQSVVDICSLIKHSIDLANGSSSKAADSLRNVATRMKKEANDRETNLEQFRNATVEHERKLRK